MMDPTSNPTPQPGLREDLVGPPNQTATQTGWEGPSPDTSPNPVCGRVWLTRPNQTATQTGWEGWGR